MAWYSRNRSQVALKPVEQTHTSVIVSSYQKKRKNRWRLAGICGMLIILLVPSLLACKAWLSYRSISQKHSGVSAAALQKTAPSAFESSFEAESRVNILLLGIGDDAHAGSLLADTVMVMSIDPESKDVALLSLPRDLYVSIPGIGYDKLNAAHSYGEQNKDGEGPNLMKEVVSRALDVPIHNYIRVDFTGFAKAIDTLGGVTIENPYALYDPEYPCAKNEGLSCGFRLPAGTQNLNGASALQYVRCRKGNCGNDFGRAARQQQVLVAAREKALSLQTLSSPAKLMGLLDTFGRHVRTDLSSDEISRLADITKGIDPKAIRSKVVDEETERLVTTANRGGASVVVPMAADGSFREIQNFVHTLFFDRHIVDEALLLEVVDATGKPAQFERQLELLTGYRYQANSAAARAAVNQDSQLIYAPGTQAKFSLRYLEKRYKLTAREDSSVTRGARLILGQNILTNKE